jgi:steroid delta-isomerase-like uncharacterized protein
MAKLIEIAKQHLDALAKGDWKSYRSMLTEGAVYEEEATQRRVQGADRYVDAIKPWKNAFPDMKVKIKEIIASGDAVVAEVEWEGTNQGELAGPFGTIPPTKRHGKLPGVIMMRFDGDKIRETHVYFDLMTLFQQMGAMPQPSAAQPSSR